MSEPVALEAGANPFAPRSVLALVALGAIVFVALLWMIGAGMTGGSINDGGGHVGGRGLNGYAALADLLERRGHAVRRLRTETAFDDAGLLVLTPPHAADGAAIGKIIEAHRYHGPTLLILPKWLATPVPAAMRGDKARAGWVMLSGAFPPRWGNDVPQLGGLDLKVEPRTGNARWQGMDRSGTFADTRQVQSLSSGRIVPLVRDGEGQVMAGYLYDEASHPALEAAAHAAPGGDEDGYPVVVVAEPDFFDNYGLADRERAVLALAVVSAATDGQRLPVLFDLTLNGHGRSANLLTLAFTPPFLAATLCLLLAALAVGWRAFLRFGPPLAAGRAIAFGKRALVANTAGLIRRSRRLHLVTAPYATRARERLTRVLALSRHNDPAMAEAAIDRALAARNPDAQPFSAVAARLRTAHRPHDILKAAQDLHALERTLIR